MLSDEMIQLLTAFVDGELNERQRQAVMRLLRESSEARELLKQLQENAHRLKKLPRHKVEPSLAEPVLQAIAVQKTQPAPVAQPARRKRAWLPYVAATMAASVLIAVIAVIVWQSIHSNGGTTNIAKIEEKKEPEPKQPPTPNPVPQQKAPTPVPNPTPPQPKPINPLLAKVTEGTFRDFASPIIPFSASFADLKKDGKATNLFVMELKSTKSVQLDVTVKKNTEAMARLNNVLKNQGIKLVGDSLAKKTADKKNAEFQVYAENLTLDEVTALVNELGSDYVMGLGTTEKKMSTPFHKATLNALETDAKQKIAKVIGDAPKKKPEGKERMVIVLPGSTSGATAAEVRQFVNQRGAPQPGTVQVLIKIRQE